MSSNSGDYKLYLDPICIGVTVVVIVSISILIYAMYSDQVEWENLKNQIPNMDCKELTKAHIRYNYWLDGDDSAYLAKQFFDRYDLFDVWYDQMGKMRCIIP